MTTYNGIGLMSGTSLDGLDLCWAKLIGDIERDVWSYRIIKAVTIPYSESWRKRLKDSTELSGVDLIQLHFDYGHFLGQSVSEFIQEENIVPDLVASHGHTVFHQPEKSFTFQLGDGETTAAYIKCPFVTNFRSKDLALGGHGAPLAPFGEKYLFAETDICINLGGIVNIGIGGSKGYDICPCNIIFNKLARLYCPDLEYDRGGQIAAEGVVKTDLIHSLDDLNYYKMKPPKSLGIEWISQYVFPLLNINTYSIQDIMRTVVEHVTNKITQACFENRKGGTCSVLITGGGALNTFLMKILSQKLNKHNIIIKDTDEETINYKESLIFAFLGLRSLLGLTNINSDITGSKCDTISGSIHRPITSSASDNPTFEKRFV